MYPLHQIIRIVNASTYKFDTSGVVGMLGGDNAADAVETIHLHVGRRWAGWYNYAGTLTVAKRFGQMANSHLWDSLFPGTNLSPAATFGLDSESGPDLNYSGSYSGTRLTTKYLGRLIADACKELPGKELILTNKDGSGGRKTRSSAVTVISLPSKQHDRIKRIGTNTSFTSDEPKSISVPPNSDCSIALWAIVPSLVSIAACVLCLLAHDPICASLILVGILSSGFSSMILGGAKLEIHVPVPSAASPPGDGLMFPKDGSIIVLKGEEADVNIITKGVFELDYSLGKPRHGPDQIQKHHWVGVSSLLLMAQFLVQLLLIPRSTFFGQILYLVSFVASGIYHLWVASHERGEIQRGLLLQILGIQVKEQLEEQMGEKKKKLTAKQMEKRTLGTRTQMAVFVCLLLGNGRKNPSACRPDIVLTSIIPNETPVWKYWRRKVIKELDHFWRCDLESSSLYCPSIQAEPEDQPDQDEYSCFTEKDLDLLGHLIDDAWCVFKKYPEWRDQETEVWKDESEYNEEKSLLLSESSFV